MSSLGSAQWTSGFSPGTENLSSRGCCGTVLLVKKEEAVTAVELARRTVAERTEKRMVGGAERWWEEGCCDWED